MADLAQLHCSKQCPHQWEDRKGGGGEGEKEGRREGEDKKNAKNPIEIQMSRKDLLFNNLHVSNGFQFSKSCTLTCYFILPLEQYFKGLYGAKESANSIWSSPSYSWVSHAYISSMPSVSPFSFH